MENIPVMMVLHAYQPPYPIQKPSVVDRIIKNCYRPIALNLEKHNNVKLVININASLTEILIDAAPDVLESLSRSAEEGKIEFLESGAYHPIFPLISLKQVKIQLQVNNKINKEAFGPVYQPQGIWPPELAVDHKTLQLFSEKGYNYAIVPENSINNVPKSKIPYLHYNTREFSLIRRDKHISNAISFDSHKEVVNNTINHINKEYQHKHLPIVIATDMETFGEHHVNYWKFLFQLLSNSSLEPILSESLIQESKKMEVSEVANTSWSTEDSDVKSGIGYPLWDHPKNPIHAIQHTHFSIVEKLYEEELGFDHLNDDELKLYLKSAQSCQYWWADRNHGRWSPEIITKGLELQRQAILHINNELSKKLSSGLTNRLERLLKL